jgi:hypothetical protein
MPVSDAAQAVKTEPSNPPGEGYFAFVWLMLLAAAGLAGFGVYRMYAYDITTDRIVGGDAYNYTILATRGVGLIAAGCRARARQRRSTGKTPGATAVPGSAVGRS